jgi:hypothetical protein
VRLAYADPPYPGKAHLYPEDTEVDHEALIARLMTYDGWALSTDERSLAYVLSICPDGVRILAWCRSTAPPFLPFPSACWEPVLLWPARTRGVEHTRSYIETNAATGFLQRGSITGQKTPAFNRWVIRCMGAVQGDTLDDLFPGTGGMGEAFSSFSGQLTLGVTIPSDTASNRARANMLRRYTDPIPGLEPAAHLRERVNSGRT